MNRKLNLCAAALLLSLAATATKADPVFNFAVLQESLANPNFSSRLLVEAGVNHNADLRLGSTGDKSFSAMEASIDFTFAPEGCRLEVQEVVGTPEPATMILLGTGLVGIGAVVRKARKKRVLV